MEHEMGIGYRSNPAGIPGLIHQGSMKKDSYQAPELTPKVTRGS